MNDLKVVERGLFSNNDPDSPPRVARYPSLARLKDGRVLCTFGTANSDAIVWRV